MMTQSRVLAVAVIGVVAIIGGVTLLDGANDANTTAVAVAPSAVETSIAATEPFPVATIPVNVPVTTPASIIPPPPDAGCALTGPSAAIDRDRQLAWLCRDGYITTEFPISTAWSMPDPGEYEIYAKDRRTTSTLGGYFSTLKNFVAFSYGKNTGARVAFHSIPILSDGSLIQPIDSVGDLSRRGESAGCIRVQPDISELLWDTLSIGDTVTVLT